jgi:SAM-dependent methyltransferase
MKIFQHDYASHYDLFYADKNYSGEADYVASRIRACCPKAVRLLELGCGTGRHAGFLAKRGFDVVGVDRSRQMVEQARKRASIEVPRVKQRLNFRVGDVMSYRSRDKFDVVISLFNVVGYLTRNEALQKMFAVVKSHLRKGGVFLFDVWYGPAVLSKKPVVRVKRIKDRQQTITRTAVPHLDVNNNTVQVDYTIRCRQNSEVSATSESHLVRYFFLPELELILAAAGLDLIRAEEWMTGKAPGTDTWGLCCVCRPAKAKS